MAEIGKNMKPTYSKKIRQGTLNLEELNKLSNEELIQKVIQLEAHNTQLKNIIKKKFEEVNDLKIEKSKEFNFKSVTMRHVFLKLYYLGWNCKGFVTQDDTSNTIENYLFKALKQCCLIENRETSNYHRCGRTDRGVSAFCQVISIDLRSKLSDPNINNCKSELPYCTMLNRLLPDHIRCYAWSHVDSSCSARFDCSSRTYNYYFPKGCLNIALMKKGIMYLIGNHDFRNFCKMDVGNGVTEFTRSIMSADIVPCLSEQEESEYGIYKLTIRGNGFLWHQIRCIMGVIFLIGEGKESPEIIKKLLDVSENPKKPQYSMASYMPLNLFHGDYQNVNTVWNVDDKEILQIIKLLQKQWTSHSVKQTMIREMIDELLKLQSKCSDIKYQTESLLEGVRSKIYKPLLTRMRCESLENRIEHYMKRRKLVKESENE